MKRSEVKALNQKLISLANHSIEKKVDNFHFNYALGENVDRFATEVKKYEKAIPTELKEIEGKVIESARDQYKEMEEEARKLVKDPFELGMKVLTEEETARHTELMKAYDEFLAEESELKVYFFNPEKIGDVKLEFAFSQILRTNFLKPE